MIFALRTLKYERRGMCLKRLFDRFLQKKRAMQLMNDTVDARIPAPPEMY